MRWRSILTSFGRQPSRSASSVFCRKPNGRIAATHTAGREEEAKVSIPVEVENLPSQLQALVATLQESSEFREACPHLHTIYQAGGEPWELLKPLLAHHAREASPNVD